MAIAAIYVLLTIAVAFLIIALNRKDFSFAFLSATLFILGGLHIIIRGFEDLAVTFKLPLGVVIIAIGAYVGIRAGVDFISENL